MSFYHSRNGGNNNRGASGASGGDAIPSTMTVMVTNGRMAIISAYSNNRGERLATVNLCEISGVPAAVAGKSDVIYFGNSHVRETVSVADAIKMAEQWLKGEAIGSETL